MSYGACSPPLRGVALHLVGSEWHNQMQPPTVGAFHRSEHPKRYPRSPKTAKSSTPNLTSNTVNPLKGWAKGSEVVRHNPPWKYQCSRWCFRRESRGNPGKVENQEETRGNGVTRANTRENWGNREGKDLQHGGHRVCEQETGNSRCPVPGQDELVVSPSSV